MWSTDTTKQDQTASDDLMTFSISPITIATTQTHKSARVQIEEEPHERTSNDDQDLIKFSITPKDAARIRDKHTKNVPGGQSHGHNLSDDSHVMSHDQRVTQNELNPKWDHFASSVSETTFGMDSSKGRPLSEPIVLSRTDQSKVGVASTIVGGVSDADHWAVLSMVGAEKILSPNGELMLAGTAHTHTHTHTHIMKQMFA